MVVQVQFGLVTFFNVILGHVSHLHFFAYNFYSLQSRCNQCMQCNQWIGRCNLVALRSLISLQLHIFLWTSAHFRSFIAQKASYWLVGCSDVSMDQTRFYIFFGVAARDLKVTSLAIQNFVMPGCKCVFKRFWCVSEIPIGIDDAQIIVQGPG